MIFCEMNPCGLEDCPYVYNGEDMDCNDCFMNKGDEEIHMTDNVNHPSHYTDGKVEVIDYIKDKLTADQFLGYCIGNTIKYISRFQKKGNPKEDLEKARVYLGWAIEAQEELNVSDSPDDDKVRELEDEVTRLKMVISKMP